eukprot:6179064-Pleurochrysis_carterae.AAC.2
MVLWLRPPPRAETHDLCSGEESSGISACWSRRVPLEKVLPSWRSLVCEGVMKHTEYGCLKRVRDRETGLKFALSCVNKAALLRTKGGVQVKQTSGSLCMPGTNLGRMAAVPYVIATSACLATLRSRSS